MCTHPATSAAPNDEEESREYEARILGVVGRYGGVPVARDPRPLVWEADAKPALGVVPRFDDKQVVEAFYHPDEYAPPKAFRRTLAEAGAPVVEGP